MRRERAAVENGARSVEGLAVQAIALRAGCEGWSYNRGGRKADLKCAVIGEGFQSVEDCAEK
jgi:hypothetical protein